MLQKYWLSPSLVNGLPDRPDVNVRARKPRPVNRAETVAQAMSRIDPALFDSPLIYHRAGQASAPTHLKHTLANSV
jgi:hypothetical protein